MIASGSLYLLCTLSKSRERHLTGFSGDKLRCFLLSVQFWFFLFFNRSKICSPWLHLSLSFSGLCSRRGLQFFLSWVPEVSIRRPITSRHRSSSHLHSKICMVKRRMVSQWNLLTSSESMSSVTSVLVLGKKFAHTLVSVPATGQTKYCSKKTKKIHACRLCSY